MGCGCQEWAIERAWVPAGAMWGRKVSMRQHHHAAPRRTQPNPQDAMNGWAGLNTVYATAGGRFYMRRRARAPGDDPLCPAELSLNLNPLDAATGTTAVGYYPPLIGYINGETYSNLVSVPNNNGSVVRCASIQLSNATRILAIGFGIEATTPEGGPGPLNLSTAVEYEVISYRLGGIFEHFPGERGRADCLCLLPVCTAFTRRDALTDRGGRGRMPRLTGTVLRRLAPRA